MSMHPVPATPETTETGEFTGAARPGAGVVAPLGLQQRRDIRGNMLARFAAVRRLGPLRPGRVDVSEGSSVHIAGIDATRAWHVEADHHVGKLTPEHLTNIVQDLFKLSLVARMHPGSRVVLLVGDEDAAESVRAFIDATPSVSLVEIVAMPVA